MKNLTETLKLKSLTEALKIKPISEVLKINSKSKVNTVRYLSKKDIPEHFFDNFTAHEGDLDNFFQDIINRKKTPEEFIKDIRYKEQLFIYWFNSVYAGWKEAYDAFKTEIINKGYAKENELDATAIEMIEIYKNNKETINNINDYLDYYNVKIK